MGFQQNEEDLLVRVSWWYHVDGLTQDQIASRLHFSRPSVGRMLERARAMGITEIRIAPAYLRRQKLGLEIKEKFNLRDVVVVPDPINPRTDGGVDLERLGIAAATVLTEISLEAKTIAIGWGEAVASTFASLPNDFLEEKDLVSLTGGVNVYAMRMSREHMLSNRGFFTGLIPAPLFVAHPDLARALSQETTISSLLTKSRNADVAFIGVGGNTSAASLVRSGVMTETEMVTLRAGGAVGDLLGVFFDEHGERIKLDLDSRRIGIDLDGLKKIPTVVGIAGGEEKIPSILGALRGGYLDVLVTDVAAAQAVARGEREN